MHGEAQGGLRRAEDPEGALRVGQINLEAGSYTRWVRLSCWRIPAKIWEGLPIRRSAGRARPRRCGMNRVLLCGMECFRIGFDGVRGLLHGQGALGAQADARKPKPVDPFAARHAPPPPPKVEAAPSSALALPDAPGAGPSRPSARAAPS